MTTTEELEWLVTSVRRFDTAVLVTHGASGELHARPMTISDVSATAELWFVTSELTPKVVEARADGRALAVMQAGGRYVSVSGHLRTETRRELVEPHLSAVAEWWLDPNQGALTALVLEPLTAEIWDSALPSTERAAARPPNASPQVEHTLIPFTP